MNFHQRRITNAAPSVDDYDYVVRKELKKFAGEVEDNLASRVEGIGTLFDVATFGIAIDTDLIVDNDTNPWWVCPHTAAQLIWMVGYAKTPSTGADIICRFNKNPVDPASPLPAESILSTNFTLPAGSSARQVWTTFDISSFTLLDLITLDVTQIGSSTPGGDVYFKMKFRVTDVNPL